MVFKLMSESETLAVAIMTAISKGCQARPFFNVLLERIIYVGFHCAQSLLACLVPAFVIWGTAVGADMLSYLAVSASWPALTQNNVRGK